MRRRRTSNPPCQWRPTLAFPGKLPKHPNCARGRFFETASGSAQIKSGRPDSVIALGGVQAVGDRQHSAVTKICLDGRPVGAGERVIILDSISLVAGRLEGEKEIRPLNLRVS